MGLRSTGVTAGGGRSNSTSPILTKMNVNLKAKCASQRRALQSHQGDPLSSRFGPSPQICDLQLAHLGPQVVEVQKLQVLADWPCSERAVSALAFSQVWLQQPFAHRTGQRKQLQRNLKAQLKSAANAFPHLLLLQLVYSFCRGQVVELFRCRFI